MWESIAGTIQDGVYNNIGMLYNDLSARRSQKWQKELMDIQFKNQQQLDTLGQQLQLDTWEKTNYPAQVSMLKEAGLNPALLYAKGGPGGTTGSQTGGSSASGSAPTTAPNHFLDMSQNLLLSAQVELMKAEANKANADADKTRGVDTKEAESRIAKLIQETTNETLKAKLIELETDIAEIEKANRDYKLNAEINYIIENVNNLHLENSITTEAFDSIVSEIKAKSIGQTIENELTQAKVNLTQMERQQIITSLTQKWTELGIKGRELDLQSDNIKINKFEAEIRAENPTLGQVAGSIAKKAYISVKNIENAIRGKERRDIKDTVK